MIVFYEKNKIITKIACKRPHCIIKHATVYTNISGVLNINILLIINIKLSAVLLASKIGTLGSNLINICFKMSVPD